MAGVGKKSRTIRRNRRSQFPLISIACSYLNSERTLRVRAPLVSLNPGLSRGMSGHIVHSPQRAQQFSKRNPWFPLVRRPTVLAKWQALGLF